MSEILQNKLDMADMDDSSTEISIETKDNLIDVFEIEYSDSVSSKSNRELKALLALSKEANLDVDIVHKRKSTENRVVDKPEQGVKIEMTESEIQSQAKSNIIRFDYKKSEAEASTNEAKDDVNTFLNSRDDISDEYSECGGEAHRTNSTNVVIVINNKRKDPFCWRCHHDKSTLFCETCPRSFHQKCLKSNVTEADDWVCPVCVEKPIAESARQRIPAMRGMTTEHFCGLLKFALKRMTYVEGHEPFISPVNEKHFPDYKKYVAQPQDLSCLEKNIKNRMYDSVQAFEADAQWILHNSIIFNSYQSKLTSIAKSLMKVCKQEMSEIENCANCYLNANTKKKTWFVEVCPKPHVVVWAKLKGFPYWPAKAMKSNSLGMVDVRFFGAHDRAWVPFKDCWLYCQQDPNSNKQKRNDIFESIKELNVYIENLKRMYGEFRYAPYRVLFDPEQELKQLRICLPRYSPDCKINPGRGFRRSLHRNGNCSPEHESLEPYVDESSIKVNEDKTESLGNDVDAIQLTCNNFDIIEESNDVSRSPNCESEIRIQDECIQSSENIEVCYEAPLTRKRLPSEDLDDCPPKLSRHDSDETSTPNDNEISESCLDISRNEKSNQINEIDCPKLTDETQTLTELPNPSESPEESAIESKTVVDTLFETLSDLIDEVSEEGEFVSETGLLLDISNKDDRNIKSPPKAPVDSLIVDNGDNDLVLSASLTDSKTYDTDEVCVTEIQELTESLGLQVPLNIKDIVQADDVSRVSITAVEPEVQKIIPVKEKVGTPKLKNIIDLVEPDTAHSILIDSIEILDENINSCSSADELTNPLDFVEVTESTPASKGGSSEEENTRMNLSDLLNSSEPVKPAAAIESQNKRKLNTADEPNLHVRKSLKLVNIDEIRNKILDTTNQSTSTVSKPVTQFSPSEEPIKSLQSLLEKHLSIPGKNSESFETGETVVIKSEPNSDEELSEAEYMELKRRYLSALDISEKLPRPPKKPVSMRTRSKSEENKVKNVNNLSRVIDDVARSADNTDHHHKNLPYRRKEIFIKPLAKMQIQKQKARKSFPIPIKNVYPGATQRKEMVRIGKTLTNIAPARASPMIKPSETFTSSNNIVYVSRPSTINTALTILPPNQPITFSANRNNSTLTLNHHQPFVPTETSVPTQNTTNPFESQNYIPLSGEVPKPRTVGQSKISLVPITSESSINSFTQNCINSVTPTVSTVTASTISSSVSTPSAVSELLLNGLGTLPALRPETLHKTISDVMCRAPPKLKRRPPGPLSSHFDEGLPSSAGTVTSRVNSISHRLGDYFRGMLIELLQEMSATDSPEAEITKLKLEIEDLKHKHNEEIVEIKKNVSTLLQDVQKSIEDERTQIIEDTRSTCEIECVKRVEEAKSKQWCTHCFKEAQYYCCWNTSYCDFSCQEKHWSKHMSTCTQNIQNLQSSQTIAPTILNNTSSIKPPQSLILRQTPLPKPKTFTPKAIIGKPTKVIVSRPGTSKNIGYVRASGNHITIVESTPGNYELVGNGGPISVGGKLITGLGKIRNGNVISLPSSSASTSITGNTHKAVVLSQTKPVQASTVISDKE